MTEMDAYKKLGDKLRKLRKDSKISQKDLGLKTGIPQPDISAFESRGENIRSVEKINALFDVFGLELELSGKKTTLIYA